MATESRSGRQPRPERGEAEGKSEGEESPSLYRRFFWWIAGAVAVFSVVTGAGIGVAAASFFRDETPALRRGPQVQAEAPIPRMEGIDLATVVRLDSYRLGRPGQGGDPFLSLETLLGSGPSARDTARPSAARKEGIELFFRPRSDEGAPRSVSARGDDVESGETGVAAAAPRLRTRTPERVTPESGRTVRTSDVRGERPEVVAAEVRPIPGPVEAGVRPEPFRVRPRVAPPTADWNSIEEWTGGDRE